MSTQKADQQRMLLDWNKGKRTSDDPSSTTHPVTM